MKNCRLSFLWLVLAASLLLAGCFGDDDKGSTGTVLPASYVNLSGSVTPPATMESTLLASVKNNTDSEVRTAFAAATVFVNGTQIASFTLNSSTGTSWPLQIYNVAQSANGKYDVHVVAGQIALKSNISDSEKGNFVVNIETTAAAMLAEAMKKSQSQMLASYPAIVSALKADLTAALLKTKTELGANLLVSNLVKQALATHSAYITALGEFNSNGKLVYLQPKNDLDGDGVTDLQIVQVGGGQRLRFYTALATATSLLENTANLDVYTDTKLLQDFAGNLTSENNTFAADNKDFSLGLFFKRSAAGDQYLKLLVRRIDLNLEGVFSGVVAEYSYIATATTAITTGSKIFMLTGGSAVEGGVFASDFLTDGNPTENNLSYVSVQAGLGSSNGSQLLVAHVDGQNELSALSSAYKSATGLYFANTGAALADFSPGRTLQVGDVFAAWFPTGNNYALFKIKQIDANSITVDYKVNSTPNEPRF